MTVPTVATYSAQALIDAHTALLALFDAGSGAAKLKMRDASDALLWERDLDDPAGTVNGTTGQLTLAWSGDDPAATTGGTPAYVEITDSDDNVHLSLPVAQGVAALSGYAVLNSLTVVAGVPVAVLLGTIG